MLSVGVVEESGGSDIMIIIITSTGSGTVGRERDANFVGRQETGEWRMGSLAGAKEERRSWLLSLLQVVSFKRGRPIKADLVRATRC